MKINSICVLGGGTAGFSVASVLARYRKLSGLEFDIQVIHSDKIGSIGVGESTLININAPNMDESLRIISSFEELYNSQEIDDLPANATEEEIRDMKYDMQEEFDALDLDGYDDEDDPYMPESQYD